MNKQKIQLINFQMRNKNPTKIQQKNCIFNNTPKQRGDYSFRRLDLVELDFITKFITSQQQDKIYLLYGYSSIVKLFQSSLISVTIIDKNHKVIGAACFHDSPPRYKHFLHQNLWQNWLLKSYNDLQINSQNAIWLTFMTLEDAYAKQYPFIMERVFQNIHSFLPKPNKILFLKSGQQQNINLSLIQKNYKDFDPPFELLQYILKYNLKYILKIPKEIYYIVRKYGPKIRSRNQFYTLDALFNILKKNENQNILIPISLAIKYCSNRELILPLQPYLHILKLTKNKQVSLNIAYSLAYQINNNQQIIPQNLLNQIQNVYIQNFAEIKNILQEALNNKLRKSISVQSKSIFRSKGKPNIFIKNYTTKPKGNKTKKKNQNNTVHKTIKSEKSENKILNFSLALKKQYDKIRNQKKKNLQKNSKTVPIMIKKCNQQQGSDIYPTFLSFNFSFKDLINLYNKVISGGNLKTKDKQIYLPQLLFNKQIQPSQTRNWGMLGISPIPKILMSVIIIQILYEISQRQILSIETIDKLLLSLNLQKSVSKYYCQIWFVSDYDAFVCDQLIKQQYLKNIPILKKYINLIKKLKQNCFNQVKLNQQQQKQPLKEKHSRMLLPSQLKCSDKIRKLFLELGQQMTIKVLKIIKNYSLIDQKSKKIIYQKCYEKLKMCLEHSDSLKIKEQINKLQLIQYLSNVPIQKCTQIYNFLFKSNDFWTQADYDQYLNAIYNLTNNEKYFSKIFNIKKLKYVLNTFSSSSSLRYKHSLQNTQKIMQIITLYHLVIGIQQSFIRQICFSMRKDDEQMLSLKLKFLILYHQKFQVSQYTYSIVQQKIDKMSKNNQKMAFIIIYYFLQNSVRNLTEQYDVFQTNSKQIYFFQKLTDTTKIYLNDACGINQQTQQSIQISILVGSLWKLFYQRNLCLNQERDCRHLIRFIEVFQISQKELRLILSQCVMLISKIFVRFHNYRDLNIQVRLKIVKSLINYISSTSGRINFNIKVAYVNLLKSFLAKYADPLQDEILNILSQIYTIHIRNFQTNDKEVALDLNNNILKILEHQATKQNTCFKQPIFLLLNKLLMIQYRLQKSQDILKIIEVYTSKPRLIPQLTLSLIYPFKKKSIKIIENVINNKQRIHQIFIEQLIRELYLNNNQRKSSFELLQRINQNQQLEENAFRIIQIERSGLNILKNLNVSQSLKYLKDWIEKGYKATISAFESLANQINNQQILQMILIASSRGQIFPQSLITSLINLFKPNENKNLKVKEIALIIKNLVKSNQYNQNLVSKLKQIKQGIMQEQQLQILVLLIQKGMVIPVCCVTNLVKSINYLQNLNLKCMILSALCCINLQQFHKEILLKEIRIIFKNNNHKLCIQSLKIFYKITLKTKILPDDIHLILDMIKQSKYDPQNKQHIIKILKKFQIVQFKQQIQVLREKFIPTVYLHSIHQCKTLSIFHFNQMNKIIQQQPSYFKQIMQIVANCQKYQNVPEKFITNITQIFQYQPKEKHTIKNIYQFIKKLVNNKINLQHQLLSVFLGLSQGTEEQINNILKKIKQNQIIPFHIEVRIKIKNINTQIKQNKYDQLIKLRQQVAIFIGLKNKFKKKDIQNLFKLFQILDEDQILIDILAQILLSILKSTDSLQFCYSKYFLQTISELIIKKKYISNLILFLYSQVVQHVLILQSQQQQHQQLLKVIQILINNVNQQNKSYELIIICILNSLNILFKTDDQYLYSIIQKNKQIFGKALKIIGKDINSLKQFSILDQVIIWADVKLRTLIFQTLKKFKDKKIQVNIFYQCCENIRKKIKQTILPKEVEISQQLIQVIVSLKQIDLRILKEQSVTIWIKQLLLYDLISDKQEIQKINILKQWSEIQKNKNISMAQKQKILRLFHRNQFNYDQLMILLDFLQNFEFEVIIKTLQKNKEPFPEIKVKLIQKKLKNIIPNENIETIRLLSLQLHKQLNIKVTVKLLNSLKVIEKFNLIQFKSLKTLILQFQINEQDISDAKQKYSLKEMKLQLEVVALLKLIVSTSLKKQFYNILLVLVNEWSFQILLKKIFFVFPNEKKTKKAVLDRQRYLLDVLVILYQYKFDPNDIDSIKQILQQQNHPNGIKKLNYMLVKLKFPQLNNKNLTQLIQQTIELNPKFPIKQQELMLIIQKISLQKNTISIDRNIISKQYCNWDKETILKWSQKIKTQNIQYYKTNQFIIQAIIVIQRAIFLFSGFNLKITQIIASLIAINLNHNQKGRLLQVSTGQGKSTIICILAIIYALQNKKVDIITTSSVLSERDAYQKVGLYQYFGLTCAQNSDKGDEDGTKECYTKNIVYGQISNYQFDFLREKYSKLKTRGKRQFEIAIVDQIDNMLIDDGQKIAKLSTTIAGLDQLQPLYYFIWNQLINLESKILQINNKFYIFFGKLNCVNNKITLQYLKQPNQDTKIIQDLQLYISQNKDISNIGKIIGQRQHMQKYIQTHIQSYIKDVTNIDSQNQNNKQNNQKQIFILPTNFKAFAKKRLSKWIDSAINAFTFQENIQYTIQNGNINPVDYNNTGIIQRSTNWGYGLHQFLQLKHGLNLTSETLTTNFISNTYYFKLYKQNLIGLTGTLGSLVTRKFICEHYNVDSFIIPREYKYQCIQFPQIILQNTKQWTDEIYTAINRELLKGRGILVICQSIYHAETMMNMLKDKKCKIKLYTKNSMNQQKYIQNIEQNQIIIATNLAGRGTDINIQYILKQGGLHVIITFIPQNQRVKQQLFGRVARQGKPGTAQLIVNGQRLIKPVQSAQLLLNQIVQSQKTKYKNFREDLLKIQAKDRLFQKFYQFLDKIQYKWKQKKMDIENVTPNLHKQNVIAAIEQKWAIFLQQFEDLYQIYPYQTELYQGFECQIYLAYQQYLNSQKSKIKQKTKKTLIQNYYYHVGIGNYYFLCENHEKSLSQYEKAIILLGQSNKLEGSSNSFAYIGKARALLYIKKENYKVKAIQQFNKGLKLLNNQISNLLSCGMLMKQRLNNECDLIKQINQKINILRHYCNSIENNIQTLKCSLKFIDIVARSKSTVKSQQNLIQTQILSVIEKQQNYSFDLTFNNLIMYSDMWDTDYAIKSINTIQKNKQLGINKGNIKLKDLSRQQMKNLIFQTTQLNGLTTQKALKQLDNFSGTTIDLKIIQRQQMHQFSQLIKEDVKIKIKQHREKNKQIQSITLKMKFNNEISKIINKKSVNIRFSDLFIKQNFQGTIKKLNQLEYQSLNLIIFGKRQEVKNLVKKYQKCINAITIISQNGINRIQSRVKYITNCKEIIISDVIKKTLCVQLVLTNKKDTIQILQNYKQNIISKNIIVGGEFIKLEKIDNKETIVAIQQYLQTNISLNLNDLQTNQLKILIPFLRKQKYQFSLQFTNLTNVQGKTLLKCTTSFRQQTSLLMSQNRTLKHIFPKLQKIYNEFSLRGIFQLVQFQQKPQFLWRTTIVLGIITLFQVVGGTILIASGFGASLGMSLIIQGISDIFTLYRVVKNRKFDWIHYGIGKAVSFILMGAELGLTKLKTIYDGIKGGKQLMKGAVQAVVQNIGQKAIQNVVIKQQLLGLSGKFILVQFGKQLVKQKCNQVLNMFINFSLKKFKPNIYQYIHNKVNQLFGTQQYQQFLQQLFKLNHIFKLDIKNKIYKIISQILNPEKSDFEKYFLDDFIFSLFKGLMTRQYGSKFTIGVLIFNIFHGFAKLTQIIDNPCNELIKKLCQFDKHYLNINYLLNKQINNESSNKLIKIFKDNNILVKKVCKYRIPFHNRQYQHQYEYLQTQQINNIKKQSLESLSTQQKKVLNKFQKNIQNQNIKSQIINNVADKISDKVIQIIQQYMITPAASLVVSKLINYLEAKLYDKIGVQSVRKQIQQKEKQFFCNHFFIVAALVEKKAQNQNKSQVVKAYAQSIKNGQAFHITEIQIMGKLYGLKIKIVTDDLYVPTQEQIQSGTFIILFTKGQNNQIGHLQLLNKKINRIGKQEKIGKQDCGPICVQQMIQIKYGKKISIQKIRNQVAQQIQKCPSFQKNINAQKQLRKICSTNVNNLLFRGGCNECYNIQISDGQYFLAENIQDRSNCQNRTKKVKIVRSFTKFIKDGDIIRKLCIAITSTGQLVCLWNGTEMGDIVSYLIPASLILQCYQNKRPEDTWENHIISYAKLNNQDILDNTNIIPQNMQVLHILHKSALIKINHQQRIPNGVRLSQIANHTNEMVKFQNKWVKLAFNVNSYISPLYSLCSSAIQLSKQCQKFYKQKSRIQNQLGNQITTEKLNQIKASKYVDYKYIVNTTSMIRLAQTKLQKHDPSRWKLISNKQKSMLIANYFSNESRPLQFQNFPEQKQIQLFERPLIRRQTITDQYNKNKNVNQNFRAQTERILDSQQQQQIVFRIQ